MILVDEDKTSPIDDTETFALVNSILDGSSGAAASWIGAYRPSSSNPSFASYVNWNASHYTIYLDFIEKEMDAPGKVLEIGSASGARSMLLARYGNIVTGIDLERKRHEFAKVYNAHPNITYLLGMFPLPMGSPPLPSDYDYIFCVSVLYQSGNEPASIVDRALSMLKPGGKLFIYDDPGYIDTGCINTTYRKVKNYSGLLSVVVNP